MRVPRLERIHHSIGFISINYDASLILSAILFRFYSLSLKKQAAGDLKKDLQTASGFHLLIGSFQRISAQLAGS